MISEINKLIHRIMKDPTSDFNDFALISLMANRLASKEEVEKQVDLKALCIKHNVDYNQL